MSDLIRNYAGTPTQVIATLDRDSNSDKRGEIIFRRLTTGFTGAAILSLLPMVLLGWWPWGALFGASAILATISWRQSSFYIKPLAPLRDMIAGLHADIDPGTSISMHCNLRHPVDGGIPTAGYVVPVRTDSATRNYKQIADEWFNAEMTLNDGTRLALKHGIHTLRVETLRRRWKVKYKVRRIYSVTVWFSNASYRIHNRPPATIFASVAVTAKDKYIAVRIERTDKLVGPWPHISLIEREPYDAQIFLRMAELAYKQVRRNREKSA